MRVMLLNRATQNFISVSRPSFALNPSVLNTSPRNYGARGHQVRVVDLAFERRSVPRLIRSFSPELVGISCLHILDVSATLHLADEIKALDPTIFDRPLAVML